MNPIPPPVTVPYAPKKQETAKKEDDHEDFCYQFCSAIVSSVN